MFDEGRGDHGNSVYIGLLHRFEQISRSFGIKRWRIDGIARTKPDTERRDDGAATVELAREIIRQNIAVDIFELAYPLARLGQIVFKGADRYVAVKGMLQKRGACFTAGAEDGNRPGIGHGIAPFQK